MGDTLKPRPTYLLLRGVYPTTASEVQPQGLTQIFPWDAVAAARTGSGWRAGCSTRGIR